ncbi:hypothetical protein ABIB66_008716 [Bradyrhizobium sp. F1.13.3]
MQLRLASRLLKKELVADQRPGSDEIRSWGVRGASYLATLTWRRGVRRDHPLRAIRTIVNEALSALEREFAAL